MSETNLLLAEIQKLKREVRALQTVTEHPGFAASDVALKTLTLAQFAATTSAQLAGVINDETGYSVGAKVVFSIAPVFGTSISTPAIVTASGALTVTPAAGSGVALVLSGVGDFVINTNGLVFDTSTGRLGVGSASPLGPLHLEGAGGAFVYIVRNDSTVANGGWRFCGSDNLTDAFISYNNEVSQAWAFGTGAGGATTKVVIRDGGDVGIGVDVPSYRLHVVEDANGADASILVENSYTNTAASLDETVDFRAHFGGVFAGRMYFGKDEDFTSSPNRSAFWKLTLRKDGTEIDRIHVNSAGLVALSGSLQVDGSLELGHATDTTIARVSAGLISVEGVTVTLNTANQHLTNKTVGGIAFTLATNTGAGTATLALATSAHGFLFIYSSTTNRSALYAVNSTTVTLVVGDSTYFKTTIDAGPAGNSLNAYYSGGSIYIQNNRTTGGHAGTYMLIYF